MVMGLLELLIFHGFIMYVEEGVNHGKIIDDNIWCAMVMGLQDMLLFHWFYNIL